MGIYEEPRELIAGVEGVELVEMEHHGEDAMWSFQHDVL